MKDSKALRRGALYITLPLVLIAGSYAWLAIEHGTWALWTSVVHESGSYTLGETIFYYEHFLRELPIDVGYALFLALCIAAYCPVRMGGAPIFSKSLRSITWLSTISAVILAAGSFWLAAERSGYGSAWSDLMQYRTRDDLFEYGSHWHFHWLSTVWFGCAATAAARLVCDTTDESRGMILGRSWLQWVPWSYVAVLTAVFGLSASVFVDVRYVGHQAREIMTHGPITLLLGFGIVLLILGSADREGRTNVRTENRAIPWRKIRIPAAFVVLIPGLLAWVALRGDVMSAGQSEQGIAAMVAGHVFEHVLDYAFVALTAAAVFGWLVYLENSLNRRGPTHPRS